jgi:hypothetical protein
MRSKRDKIIIEIREWRMGYSDGRYQRNELLKMRILEGR